MPQRSDAWTPRNMHFHRRRRSARKAWFPLLVLGSAAVIGAAIGLTLARTTSSNSHGKPIASCAATDGDTIRCAGERIRLHGIDAPEIPGHCREGRACVPGDPYKSTSSLMAALAGQLTIERVGKERYGRTLAVVTGANGDLSCWQLEHKQAVYKSDWDNGLRVAQTCFRAIDG